jgi:peptide/nickel transport system substrate-binding protein
MPIMRRDLDAAKKYLAQCKYKPTDFTLELSWVGEVPLEERFALLMQANFAEIGIKSEIKKIPWALFSEQVSKPENTPNVSQVFVDAVTGDPDTLLYGQYHSSSAGTWLSPEYLKDAKVDELLEKGRTADSEAGRAAVYEELNKRLLELAPDIFAYDQTAVFATSKRVTAPTLSDPSKAFRLAGMNFTYRLIEMNQ